MTLFRPGVPFWLSPQDVAPLIAVPVEEVVALIERGELGGIPVDGGHRIPRPAVSAYLERLVGRQRPVPTTASRTPAELAWEIAGYELGYGTTTAEFLLRYEADPDHSVWTFAHHRWASLARSMMARGR